MILRRAFLKRMAFAALATAFIDLPLPRRWTYEPSPDLEQRLVDVIRGHSHNWQEDMRVRKYRDGRIELVMSDWGDRI